MRPALAACCLVFASCSGEPQLVLPGKLDLEVVGHDRLKPCADDGLEDTTPDADCVLGPENDALAPYVAGLNAKGWTESGTDADRRGVWTRADGDGRRLLTSGVRERFAGDERTLLRFELIEAGATQ